MGTAVIVFDVGCARYGGDYSIERLIEEFSPQVLIGLDPQASHAVYEQAQTIVVTLAAAAWVFDGWVGWAGEGLGGHVDDGASSLRPATDLARLMLNMPGPQVLKMDAEGAEFELLPHLIAHGVPERVELAWVEWHGRDADRYEIEERWQGEMVEWRW